MSRDHGIRVFLVAVALATAPRASWAGALPPGASPAAAGGPRAGAPPREPASAGRPRSAASARGTEAPELELRDLGGTRRKLSALHGSIVVLNFWATWCPPCRAEMPALEAVSRRYAKRGVVVIGAAADGVEERVAPFVREQNVDFPIWLSVSAGDMRPFGFSEGALPATALLDRAGRIAWRKQAPVSEDELAREIDALLAGAKAAE